MQSSEGNISIKGHKAKFELSKDISNCRSAGCDSDSAARSSYFQEAVTTHCYTEVPKY
ncbi:hypothetical protein DAPPUDRAFT_315609 [Daphnia pulex]|uniref:Uncharacterized protein n=1 Tax=Daphnia pulex TaxID=6669 RepID=E9GA88_DAPPU|nr:hypothetical protein DAPPUDRAFT_315609 [Daphnia pulex]|eukprot:EFX83701.1 hypothetical protein DAPPUDRAFT_315609 [Daphnia pulex]